MTLYVRLPEEYEQRLNHLAKVTDRSKVFYIKKIIMDHLDDLEDVYLAKHRLEDLREDKDEIVKGD